jgi:Tfp pilus assembly protein PilX
MMMTRWHKGQRGITLLLTMIFLILMSLFAISTFKTSSSNVRIVGNMQVRQEGLASAQQAIELIISSTLFSTDPDLVAQSPIGVDIDGDGKDDYVVNISPKPNCYRVTPNPTCVPGAANSNGASGILIAGLTAASSGLCYIQEWNVRAVVTDPRSGMSVVVNQGVGIPSSSASCI